MALFGRKLSATHAYALGFVAEMDADPCGVAERIATGLVKAEARSTELTKYMIHAIVGEDRTALIEALSSGVMHRPTDLPEGVANIADRRKPDLTWV